MSLAVKICLLGAGTFLLVGLLTGAWKYVAIASSANHRAPTYVDVAHRASLLYSFASLVLGKLAEYSPYSNAVTVASAALPIVFFALAILSYVVHGFLDDTDNQLARPHRLGRSTLSPMVMSVFMWTLIAAEIGGSGVLFSGFVRSVVLAP